MLRTALLLVPLVACATRDVHRSEPLVARATCSGDGLAVFGYPYEQQAGCGERVVNLGNGCYLAMLPDERAQAPRRPRQLLRDAEGRETHWMPHLYECAANAPDGHVACVEDSALPPRDEVFGEDIVRVSRLVELPKELGATPPATWIPATGRCRDALDDWELAHLPPPSPRPLHTTYWHRVRGDALIGDLEPTPRADLMPIEDPIAIGRILGAYPRVRATACPEANGLAVTIDDDLPAQLAQQLEGMVARGLAEHGVESCTQFAIGIDFAD